MTQGYATIIQVPHMYREVPNGAPFPRRLRVAGSGFMALLIHLEYEPNAQHESGSALAIVSLAVLKIVGSLTVPGCVEPQDALVKHREVEVALTNRLSVSSDTAHAKPCPGWTIVLTWAHCVADGSRLLALA